MTSRQRTRLRESAATLLEPGEQILHVQVAQAAGASQSRTTRGVIGGAAGMVVGDAMHKKTEDAHAAAGEQGLQLRSPMGLILTDRRIMTLQIDGMSRGNVKELLSAVGLADVDTVERKKSFGILGAKIGLTVRGADIDVECTSKSEANDLVAAFATAKAALPPV